MTLFTAQSNTPDVKVYQVPVEHCAEAAPEIVRHVEPAGSFIDEGVKK